MNPIEHHIPFRIIDESNKELSGNIRFFREKSELIFYNKEFEEIQKLNLKKIPNKSITIKEKEIEISFENQQISILREKDRHSHNVFNSILSDIYKLNQPAEKLEALYKK